MENINIQWKVVKECLKNSKYRELLACQPVNLKNAKEKNDKNTSLLCPDIEHILQDRTKKPWHLLWKPLILNLHKNLMIPTNRHRLTSRGSEKNKLTKKKGK